MLVNKLIYFIQYRTVVHTTNRYYVKCTHLRANYIFAYVYPIILFFKLIIQSHI